MKAMSKPAIEEILAPKPEASQSVGRVERVMRNPTHSISPVCEAGEYHPDWGANKQVVFEDHIGNK